MSIRLISLVDHLNDTSSLAHGGPVTVGSADVPRAPGSDQPVRFSYTSPVWATCWATQPNLRGRETQTLLGSPLPRAANFTIVTWIHCNSCLSQLQRDLDFHLWVLCSYCIWIALKASPGYCKQTNIAQDTKFRHTARGHKNGLAFIETV